MNNYCTVPITIWRPTFTHAADTCILKVGTIASVAVISAVNQSAFRSSTPHIIHEYGTTPPPKMGIRKGRSIYVK